MKLKSLYKMRKMKLTLSLKMSAIMTIPIYISLSRLKKRLKKCAD